jgi:hypothetical protein
MSIALVVAILTAIGLGVIGFGTPRASGDPAVAADPRELLGSPIAHFLDADGHRELEAAFSAIGVSNDLDAQKAQRLIVTAKIDAHRERASSTASAMLVALGLLLAGTLGGLAVARRDRRNALLYVFGALVFLSGVFCAIAARYVSALPLLGIQPLVLASLIVLGKEQWNASRLRTG